ncbi:FxsB family cyclophane-forming radical SAM/SPASM peptide maturase [Streptomyces sp. H39-S7]|uniref:FxsB family cyclophane-forming radical SAM/SPASM peptide maturase n=1 Tax=Streptomyces sp. H39-S7 TaxID=3004357 RepID=UPI0022AF5751|nr:FxsB family cyclophane-forming radical SAM/SPASM peptide maturase [Streptomyces sp. H39-S7]MCZ4121075.1 FxsB family radical SAM/SPASM domain protein [Streptomyces sp. H39-S7]
MTARPDGAEVAHWPGGLRQFVLKMHSRCNLSCDYCYVYQAADQSWRTKPTTMSPAVIDQAAARIGAHVAEQRPDWIEVVLHGGEPLLAGTAAIAHAVTAVRAAVPATTRVRFLMQTNAVLLTRSTLDFLEQLDVRIAVSLDGDAHAHDRHRRFPNGDGSYAAASAGLGLLTSARYRHLFVGLLSVVDLETDPLETYAALAAWQPPDIGFLLPHRTWADPPPPGARYGSWLARVFDTWYPTVPRATGVRIFDEIIAVSLGARTATTAIGAGPVQYVTIESDGTIEADDILKVAYPGAPATGLNIAVDDLNAFIHSEAIRRRAPGTEALCPQCRECRIVKVCGGGAYPHRYRPGSAFDNPSAYCDDLALLIRHVQQAIARQLAA